MTDGDDDLAAMQQMVFGDFAGGVAETLLDLLGSSRGAGPVLDIACGAGLVAERIAAAGYDVRGGDMSADLVGLARQRVPGGRFLRGSIFDIDLPSARAIVAAGEAISRQCAPGDDAAFDRFIRRVRGSLERDGILVFDVAAPGRATSGARGFAEGAGWAIGSSATEEEASLIRRWILFTETEGRWLRYVREERLSLWTRDQVTGMLESAGFSVESGDSYGRLALPAGLIRYTARK